jgi:DNA-binding ferritin-like protein
MTDDIAERVRKIGTTTTRSIGRIARLQRTSDHDADYVTPEDRLADLYEDDRSQHACGSHCIDGRPANSMNSTVVAF